VNLYFGMDGQPISRDKYCELFDSTERFLARTDLPGGCWVSTVWLGLDHGFGGGLPLIFESMVFGPDDMVDLDCRRYATKEQALQGHDELVTLWTGWTPGDEHPDGAEASFLTQFITALGQAVGDQIEAPGPEPNPNDMMVVMHPKEIDLK